MIKSQCLDYRIIIQLYTHLYIIFLVCLSLYCYTTFYFCSFAMNSPKTIAVKPDVSKSVTESVAMLEQSQPDTLARAAVGRRASISKDELLDAAMHLLGPHRSVASLSLREIARAAGIAPNSFYRHFRDVDELAITLINRAGSELRQIIGEARQRASVERSVVQTSMEVFMEQLQAEHGYLQLLMREGKVGSPEFKQAVEQQLCFFESELKVDLVRLEQLHGHHIDSPELVAKAITRLVFAMGATAMEQNTASQTIILQQTVHMIHMIIAGARYLASRKS